MTDNVEGMSRHRIARYGRQAVFDALPGASWASGDFEVSKQYDIQWEQINISVFSSAILKRTAFVFANGSRFKADVIYVFVGIDGETTHFWVGRGLDKTIFYGKLTEALTAEQLAEEVRGPNHG